LALTPAFTYINIIHLLYNYEIVVFNIDHLTLDLLTLSLLTYTNYNDEIISLFVSILYTLCLDLSPGSFLWIADINNSLFVYI